MGQFISYSQIKTLRNYFNYLQDNLLTLAFVCFSAAGEALVGSDVALLSSSSLLFSRLNS